MNSTVISGRVLDWKFKKLQSFESAFYIGDILVGRVYKYPKNKLTAVYTAIGNSGAIPIRGFASKIDAASYLVDYHLHILKKHSDEHTPLHT